MMLATLGQPEEGAPNDWGVLFAILAFVGASAGVGVLIGWLAERRPPRRKGHARYP